MVLLKLTDIYSSDDEPPLKQCKITQQDLHSERPSGVEHQQQRSNFPTETTPESSTSKKRKENPSHKKHRHEEPKKIKRSQERSDGKRSKLRSEKRYRRFIEKSTSLVFDDCCGFEVVTSDSGVYDATLGERPKHSPLTKRQQTCSVAGDTADQTTTGRRGAEDTDRTESRSSSSREVGPTDRTNKKRIRKKNKREQYTQCHYKMAIDMVRKACLNICNTENPAMWEWSEAVLICLADQSIHDKLNTLTWDEAKEVCKNYEWSLNVASAIQTNISRYSNLSKELYNSRLEKMRLGLLKSNDPVMFKSPPTVSIEILRLYTPAVELTNSVTECAFNKNLFKAQIKK